MGEERAKFNADEIVFNLATGKKLFGDNVRFDNDLLDKISEIIYTDIIKDFSKENANTTTK